VRFTEINLFGVYAAPISVMMVALLGGYDRAAVVRCPLGPAALRVASLALRFRRVHDRALVDGPCVGALSPPCPTARR
jgi:hypothetical protein